jgi:pimeloyl-ACP methyl ester carboxylesterase
MPSSDHPARMPASDHPERSEARSAERSRRAAVVLVAILLAACSPSFHPGRLPGAPADAAYVDVDGVSLRYRAIGDGPTVVLVHGYGASLDSWRGVDDALAKHHRVIAIDLKGFGWSSRPAGDYSPAAHAALVWKALDQIGADDVALVGHSWGASVVLAMALDKPARVRRIALVSAYVYDDQVPSFFRWAQVGGVGELIFAMTYRERIEERVPLAYHDDRFVTQERVDAVQAEFDKPGTTAAALATARGHRFAAQAARYATIAKPALVLWGDDDQVTPLHAGERLSRDLPDARLVVVPACGHMPMVEARGALIRALREFLDEPRPPEPEPMPAPTPEPPAEPAP